LTHADIEKNTIRHTSATAVAGARHIFIILVSLNVCFGSDYTPA
jgi:hypothetical protein